MQRSPPLLKSEFHTSGTPKKKGCHSTAQGSPAMRGIGRELTSRDRVDISTDQPIESTLKTHELGTLCGTQGTSCCTSGWTVSLFTARREVEPSSTARCLKIVQGGCASLTHSHLRGESDLSRCAGAKQFDRCDSQ